MPGATNTNFRAKDKMHKQTFMPKTKDTQTVKPRTKDTQIVMPGTNDAQTFITRTKDTQTFMTRTTDTNVYAKDKRTHKHSCQGQMTTYKRACQGQMTKLSHQGQPKHKLPCQGQRTHKLPCQGQRTHKLPCQGQRTHKFPRQGQRTHKLDVNPRQSLPTTPSGQLMEQVPCWPQSSSHRWCFLPGTAAPTCSAPWAPGIPLACLPLHHGRMCQTSSGCHCPCSRPVTTGWQTV